MVVMIHRIAAQLLPAVLRLNLSHPLAAASQTRHFTELLSAPDNIMVSKRAVQQMKKVCSDGSKLRITVEGGGCSGFQYLFSLVEPSHDLDEEDVVIKCQGVKAVIDSDSLEFVRGATLDYDTELIRSAFKLSENPNAESGCSCGSSFSVKE